MSYLDDLSPKFRTPLNNQPEEAKEEDYTSSISGPSALKHPSFLKDLRDHYKSRGESGFTDEELIGKMYDDHLWNTLNMYHAALEFQDVTMSDVPEQQRLARIEKVYRTLPEPWEKGGRDFFSFDVLGKGLAAGALDPLNIIPIAGGMAKGAMLTKAAIQAGKAAPSGAKLAGHGALAGVKANAPIGAVQGGVIGKMEDAKFDEIGLERTPAVLPFTDTDIGHTAMGGLTGAAMGALFGAIGARIGRASAESAIANATQHGLKPADIENLSDAQLRAFATKAQTIERSMPFGSKPYDDIADIGYQNKLTPEQRTEVNLDIEGRRRLVERQNEETPLTIPRESSQRLERLSAEEQVVEDRGVHADQLTAWILREKNVLARNINENTLTAEPDKARLAKLNELEKLIPALREGAATPEQVATLNKLLETKSIDDIEVPNLEVTPPKAASATKGKPKAPAGEEKPLPSEVPPPPATAKMEMDSLFKELKTTIIDSSGEKPRNEFEVMSKEERHEARTEAVSAFIDKAKELFDINEATKPDLQKHLLDLLADAPPEVRNALAGKLDDVASASPAAPYKGLVTSSTPPATGTPPAGSTTKITFQTESRREEFNQLLKEIGLTEDEFVAKVKANRIPVGLKGQVIEKTFKALNGLRKVEAGKSTAKEVGEHQARADGLEDDFAIREAIAELRAEGVDVGSNAERAAGLVRKKLEEKQAAEGGLSENLDETLKHPDQLIDIEAGMLREEAATILMEVQEYTSNLSLSKNEFMDVLRLVYNGNVEKNEGHYIFHVDDLVKTLDDLIVDSTDQDTLFAKTPKLFPDEDLTSTKGVDFTKTEMSAIHAQTRIVLNRARAQGEDLNPAAVRAMVAKKIFESRGKGSSSGIRSNSSQLENAVKFAVDNMRKSKELPEGSSPVHKHTKEDFTPEDGLPSQKDKMPRIKAIARAEDSKAKNTGFAAKGWTRTVKNHETGETHTEKIKATSVVKSYKSTAPEVIKTKEGLKEVPAGTTIYVNGVNRAAAEHDNFSIGGGSKKYRGAGYGYESRELAMAELKKETMPDTLAEIELAKQQAGAKQNPILEQLAKLNADAGKAKKAGKEVSVAEAIKALVKASTLPTKMVPSGKEIRSNPHRSIPAKQGDKLAMIRHKETGDYRLLNTQQLSEGKDLSDLLGNAKIEDWEVRYVDPDDRVSTQSAMDKLWKSGKAGLPLSTDMVRPKMGWDRGRTFKPLGYRAFAGLRFRANNEGLSVEDVQLIKRLASVKRESDGTIESSGESFTGKDLIQAQRNIEIRGWQGILDIGGIETHIKELSQFYRIADVVAPDGVALPVAEKAAAIENIHTIFSRYSVEQADLASKFLKDIAGESSPIARESEGVSSFESMGHIHGSTPSKANTVGIAGRTLAGKQYTTPIESLYHEVAHWAYINILSHEDKLEFWKFIEGRFYQEGKEAKDFTAKIKENLSQEIAKNSGISAQELFANQFSVWMMRKLNPEQAKNIQSVMEAKAGAYSEILGKSPKSIANVMKKISKIFDLIFNRLTVEDELTPLFKKIYPDGLPTRKNPTGEKRASIKTMIAAEPATPLGKVVRERYIRAVDLRENIDKIIARRIEIRKAAEEDPSIYYEEGGSMMDDTLIQHFREVVTELQSIFANSAHYKSDGKTPYTGVLSIMKGGKDVKGRSLVRYAHQRIHDIYSVLARDQDTWRSAEKNLTKERYDITEENIGVNIIERPDEIADDLENLWLYGLAEHKDSHPEAKYSPYRYVLGAVKRIDMATIPSLFDMLDQRYINAWNNQKGLPDSQKILNAAGEKLKAKRKEVWAATKQANKGVKAISESSTPSSGKKAKPPKEDRVDVVTKSLKELVAGYKTGDIAAATAIFDKMKATNWSEVKAGAWDYDDRVGAGLRFYAKSDKLNAAIESGEITGNDMLEIAMNLKRSKDTERQAKGDKILHALLYELSYRANKKKGKLQGNRGAVDEIDPPLQMLVHEIEDAGGPIDQFGVPKNLPTMLKRALYGVTYRGRGELQRTSRVLAYRLMRLASPEFLSDQTLGRKGFTKRLRDSNVSPSDWNYANARRAFAYVSDEDDVYKTSAPLIMDNFGSGRFSSETAINEPLATTESFKEFRAHVRKLTKDITDSDRYDPMGSATELVTRALVSQQEDVIKAIELGTGKTFDVWDLKEAVSMHIRFASIDGRRLAGSVKPEDAKAVGFQTGIELETSGSPINISSDNYASSEINRIIQEWNKSNHAQKSKSLSKVVELMPDNKYLRELKSKWGMDPDDINKHIDSDEMVAYHQSLKTLQNFVVDASAATRYLLNGLVSNSKMKDEYSALFDGDIFERLYHPTPFLDAYGSSPRIPKDHWPAYSRELIDSLQGTERWDVIKNFHHNQDNVLSYHQGKEGVLIYNAAPIPAKEVSRPLANHRSVLSDSVLLEIPDGSSRGRMANAYRHHHQRGKDDVRLETPYMNLSRVDDEARRQRVIAMHDEGLLSEEVARDALGIVYDSHRNATELRYLLIERNKYIQGTEQAHSKGGAYKEINEEIATLLQNDRDFDLSLNKIMGAHNDESNRRHVAPVVANLRNQANFNTSDLSPESPFIISLVDRLGKKLSELKDLSPEQSHRWQQDRMEGLRESVDSTVEDDSGNRMLEDLIFWAGHTAEGSMSGQKIVISALQDLGYDSLITKGEHIANTEGSSALHGSHHQNTQVLVFDASNVLNLNEQNISNRMPPKANAANIRRASGQNFLRLVKDDDGSDTLKRETESIDDIGDDTSLKSALLSLVTPNKELTHEDLSALRGANPFRFTEAQSTWMDRNGYRWLSKWHSNHYPDLHQAFAAKYFPILNVLKKLPDANNAFTGWIKKSIPMSSATTKVHAQPKSHKKIVRALRFGHGSRQEEALSTQERSVFRVIREALDRERDLLQAKGVFMGYRENYVPQVWSKENILAHQEEFRDLMMQYWRTEKRIADPYAEVDSDDSLREAQKFAHDMYKRLAEDDDSDGLLMHDKFAAAESTMSENIDFSRVIELEKYPLLQEAFEPFLENDLESLLIKYFEGTTRRATTVDKMGTNSHAYHDYMVVINQGAKGIATLLSNDKTFEIKRSGLDSSKHPVEYTLSTTSPMPFKGKPAEATEFADALVRDFQQNGDIGVVRSILESLGYRNRFDSTGRVEGELDHTYRRRINAIIGALDDFKGKPTDVSRPHSVKLEDAMRIVMKRPIGNSPEGLRTFSKAARTFNSITLLGYTMLTSLGDPLYPIIRSGKLGPSVKAIRKLTQSDPEYRDMIRNTGVAMENIIHERLMYLYGGAAGPLSTAFFNASLLTPWTDINRLIAGATGHELFKAEQVRALNNYRRGVPLAQQSRKYKESHRLLNKYGLGEYLPEQPKADTVLELSDGAQDLRIAILRFTDDTIFQPNPDQTPQFAHTPLGAMWYQLKSFPVMMTRLAGQVMGEARHQNYKPLLALMALGPLAGSGVLAVKDIGQSRGGDDMKSRELRKRSIPLKETWVGDALKEMGYDPYLHGDIDTFAGWYVESLMQMGGFGLWADMLHMIAEQGQNGMYGEERAMSWLGGPTVGSAQSLWKVLQGIMDTSDSNYPERRAVKEIAQRIPSSPVTIPFGDFGGGNRKFVDDVVKGVMGEEGFKGNNPSKRLDKRLDKKI